jgi:uncharacterized Ntn-hydrolase superfamily protein
MDRLRQGATAKEALDAALLADDKREERQLLSMPVE